MTYNNFCGIPKIPKVSVLIADKDDKIIFRNDTARVRYSAAGHGVPITDLIDKADISRYRALVDGYSGLDRKGVFRLTIGAKRETAIFGQHIADNVILRAFILLSGEYTLLKKIYDTVSLEAFSTEQTLGALYRLVEGIPNITDSADELSELYAQIYSAKLLTCSCFGFPRMQKSALRIPYRFVGFIDFWITQMIPKMRQIDCDISVDFAPGISSSDYAALNPCGLLVMMTSLAAYLADISESRKIRLSVNRRMNTYTLEMSTDVNISLIAQHSNRISSLAELMPYDCLNLILASSISQQCGFGLSYSMVCKQINSLIFHFSLNENDIGVLGFKAHDPVEHDSIFISVAQNLFFKD